MNTEDALMNSLTKVIKHHAIDRITVSELSTDAQVSRTSFYKHFVDKYDLINSCYQKTLNKHIATHYQQPLSELIGDSLHLFYEYPEYFTAAFKSEDQNDFSHFFERSAIFEMESALKAKTGRLKLTTMEKDAIRFYAAGYLSMVCHWVLNGMTETPTRLSQKVIAIMPKLLTDQLL
ncbi:MAG TPA: hypothetical protein DCW31_00890 [Lactobacillus sp.]|nr:hypothetical protein [Lactobacillus sp.]